MCKYTNKRTTLCVLAQINERLFAGKPIYSKDFKEWNLFLYLFSSGY